MQPDDSAALRLNFRLVGHRLLLEGRNLVDRAGPIKALEAAK
jgi:hypothetical protein